MKEDPIQYLLLLKKICLGNIHFVCMDYSVRKIGFHSHGNVVSNQSFFFVDPTWQIHCKREMFVIKLTNGMAAANGMATAND